ncbi:MAG: hypothetical protein ACLFRJ_10010 [Ectothiorhodospira sp.]
MMLTRTAIRAEYESSLGATASRFTPEALDRHLDAAVQSLGYIAPLSRSDTLFLEPGTGVYPAPEDLIRPISHTWGTTAQPWDTAYAGPRPRLLSTLEPDGPRLQISPVPTHRQVIQWGAELHYRYVAGHRLTDSTSTIPLRFAGALRLRAQLEAMRELAAAGVTDPIQLHNGMGASMPANTTPAGLMEALRKAWQEEARHHV